MTHPAHPALVERDVDLTAATMFGVPARARACMTLHDEAELPGLTSARLDALGPRLVLGGGSNVLFVGPHEGLVVRVALRGREILGERGGVVRVRVAAGEDWPTLVEGLLDEGLPGLENLALIPGSAGAAPVQNIGAYGLELGERLEAVTIWDLAEGRARELPASALALAYRTSLLKQPEARDWIVTAITLALPVTWRPVVAYRELGRCFVRPEEASPRAIFDAVCTLRRSKLPDPRVTGNAGSFFHNPIVDAEAHARLALAHPEVVAWPMPDGRVKLGAGWLIDRAGWKGQALGPGGMPVPAGEQGAAVHDAQALVLVNRGGATGPEVWALAQAIQADVGRRFGVTLVPEPRIVGARSDRAGT